MQKTKVIILVMVWITLFLISCYSTLVEFIIPHELTSFIGSSAIFGVILFIIYPLFLFCTYILSNLNLARYKPIRITSIVMWFIYYIFSIYFSVEYGIHRGEWSILDSLMIYIPFFALYLVFFIIFTYYALNKYVNRITIIFIMVFVNILSIPILCKLLIS